MRELFVLSNYQTQNHDGGILNGSNPSPHRHEVRAVNMTGTLPTLDSMGIERAYSGGFDFEHMIQTLQELFEHDRQIASQPDSTRCGICYLHFPIVDLYYRDEGFYICSNCSYNLGNISVPMLRKQQHFS